MSSMSEAPPCIFDPTSGKTFVAIPAPSFVFNPSSTESTTTHYIYVEKIEPTPSLQPLFSHVDRQPRKKIYYPRVSRWIGQHAEPSSPPDHTPWQGQVAQISPASSGTTLAETCSVEHVPSAQSLEDINRFSALRSASDIPSITSGASSLLRSSLPSLRSVVSATSLRPARSKVEPPSPAADRASTPLSAQQNRLSRRRKALIFEPEHKPKKDPHLLERKTPTPDPDPEPDADMAPDVAQMMLQLQELNSFFDNGLKDMDSSMKRLGVKRGSVLGDRNPSLVLSNSNAEMLPLIEPGDEGSGEDELESATATSTGTGTRDRTPQLQIPLAVRRGQPAPASLPLHPNSANMNNEMEYPDIPTAFRGSPLGDECNEGFYAEPPSKYQSHSRTKAGATRTGSGMSTRKMIDTLKTKAESLKPRSPIPIPESSYRIGFVGRRPDEPEQVHEEDAESWLMSELNSFADDERDGGVEAEEESEAGGGVEGREREREKTRTWKYQRGSSVPSPASIPIRCHSPALVPAPSRLKAPFQRAPSPSPAPAPGPRDTRDSDTNIKPPSVNLKEWNSRRSIRSQAPGNSTSAGARFRVTNPTEPARSARPQLQIQTQVRSKPPFATALAPAPVRTKAKPVVQRREREREREGSITPTPSRPNPSPTSSSASTASPTPSPTNTNSTTKKVRFSESPPDVIPHTSSPWDAAAAPTQLPVQGQVRTHLLGQKKPRRLTLAPIPVPFSSQVLESGSGSGSVSRVPSPLRNAFFPKQDRDGPDSAPALSPPLDVPPPNHIPGRPFAKRRMTFGGAGGGIAYLDPPQRTSSTLLGGRASSASPIVEKDLNAVDEHAPTSAPVSPGQAKDSGAVEPTKRGTSLISALRKGGKENASLSVNGGGGGAGEDGGREDASSSAPAQAMRLKPRKSRSPLQSVFGRFRM